MTPFQSVTFTWWEVGLRMLSILALGLAVGAHAGTPQTLVARVDRSPMETQ
jgi:hypothetical protein